jgi:hypothetical protein
MKKEIIEGFRLSPQQKHLWLLQQRDSHVPYRVRCAVLIEGGLNTEVLEVALGKVVKRHEILRTCFDSLEGVSIPLQVITDGGLKLVNEHDLSDLNFVEQEAKIEALFRDEGLGMRVSCLSTSVKAQSCTLPWRS